MEVALRAMNLLGVFTICVHAESFTPQHLSRWLQSFEQHVAYIKHNLEFSYLGTTNHYLTDVVGLLWLGLTLPELVLATTWREWAAKELFNARGGDLVWSACDCNQHWRIKRHADVRVWR